ncbi:MAG: hypothetical protein KatS3mg109_1782 [Pirellulaceae bacterium]|nr:MAG: hypothetical protein KatS3mg109_1782 [Pirellulaceae bacterium]
MSSRSSEGWVLGRNGIRPLEFVLGDAMTKPPRNNGARHYGPGAKYGARQYGLPPKNEVPGTTPAEKWCQALRLARKPWCQALRFYRRDRKPIPPQLWIVPLDNIGTSRVRVRPYWHITAQKSRNEKPERPTTGSYKPPPTRLSARNPLWAAKKASEKVNFHPSRDTNSSLTDSRPSLPAPRAAYATPPAAASPNR